MHTNTQITKVHISTISAGDTIYHNDAHRTVSKKDIKRCDFMGISIFGDTYNLGYKPVLLVKFVLQEH